VFAIIVSVAGILPLTLVFSSGAAGAVVIATGVVSFSEPVFS